MIALLDLSQIVMSEATDYFTSTREKISIELLRHITLSRIVDFRKKFTKNMIICCDGKNYWRRGIFPNYKQNRKASRDGGKFDWNAFYQMFNQIKTEMKNDLPIKVLEVDGCEADDLIATLAKRFCGDKIVIISSDKDFIQIPLTICSSVVQWSPYHKKYIDAVKLDYSLLTHIIKGDDGVPNILTEDDDVFLVKGKRCKPITKKFLESSLKTGLIEDPRTFLSDPDVISRFERNRKLIDLREIPVEIENRINAEFDLADGTSGNFYDYCISHKLVKLLEKGVD